MFLRIIKEFFLKKIVDKRLNLYKLPDSKDKITTIGVIVDAVNSLHNNLLIKELIKSGFNDKEIEVLVFKEKLNKKEEINEPFYTLKDISIKGEVKKETVTTFVKNPFDLLISYYDEPRASLNLIAKKSQAKFKVGFASVDKRMNHLLISTSVEQPQLFVQELHKYLKVLNKI
ncbi:hypothetical protein [Flavobacterium sp.]|uniref:DUF6913 domain-containing protein n=1 Tax=Flavobacterium sp. TaxID=239 RepID=UPI003527849F